MAQILHRPKAERQHSSRTKGTAHTEDEMRYLINLSGLMACLAIMTMNTSEASAYCLVRPGKKLDFYLERGLYVPGSIADRYLRG